MASPSQTTSGLFYFQVCCLYSCQWQYPSISPVLVALGVLVSLVMPMGLPFQEKANKALVWQAETLTGFWQHELICFFFFFSFWVFYGGKKKRSQMVITGYYWLVASAFIAIGDSWLLILRHVKPDSSMDQFKLFWGGFAICLPDPALPLSFQYFELHFLYNS